MKKSLFAGITLVSLTFGGYLLSLPFQPVKAPSAQASVVTIPEVTITGTARSNVIDVPEVVITAAPSSTVARKGYSSKNRMPKQVRFLDQGPAGRTVVFQADDPVASAMTRKH